MCTWVCYLIMSLDSNSTYIGSSNNEEKRLCNHNNGRGAKRTHGQTWIPIVVVSGFTDKCACLSFEAGWKRLSRTRTSGRVGSINLMAGTNLRYTRDPKWNRILDLLYFVRNFTIVDGKFKMDREGKYPVVIVDIIVNVFFEDWVGELPWPFFVRVLENI